MKIILVQLVLTVLSVKSSIIPYSTGHHGITVINAPPPGQSIAIQAPIVPNSIALAPAHAAVVAEIPPSKIPAAVSIAESPIRIPDVPTSVITNIPSLTSIHGAVAIAGLPHPANIPAAVSIAENPATIAGLPHPANIPAAVSIAESPATIPALPQPAISVPAAVSIGETPTTIAELSQPPSIPAAISIAESPLPKPDDSSSPTPAPITESSETDETPETPEPTEPTEPTESHNYDYNDESDTPAWSVQENTATIVSSPSVIAAGSPPGYITIPAGHSIIAQSPAGPPSPIIVAAPSPPAAVTIAGGVAVAQSSPILLAAEGTYLAKTRGSEHLASLPGHINSASSINLEPAPGTI